MYFPSQYGLRAPSGADPGEEAGIADVVQPAELGGEPLQADAQSAVGGHAVPVDHQVAGKLLGMHAPVQHFSDLLVVVVDALAAGGDLQSHGTAGRRTGCIWGSAGSSMA